LASLLHGGIMTSLTKAIGNRAEGNTGKNCDDSDDNEEFNEGETASTRKASGTAGETVMG
jgi:hypothetical protein